MERRYRATYLRPIGTKIVTNTAELDKPKNDIERIASVLLHSEKLHAHPANPPDRMRTENLTELIESIDRYGQREACRARELESIGHYQLLSGHRRAAACQILGVDVRVELVECTDTEALREVMLGNAQRQDLNPIERADLLQTMIGAGIDREESGAMFGLNSDSGIKNTLRLLKLPKSIRDMITAGKIPVRAARVLIPYSEATTFLNKLAKDLSDDKWGLRDFLDEPDKFELLRFDGQQHADVRPMAGKYSPGWDYEESERKFEPTGTELKKLQIATVTHEGKQIEVAQNVKLFDKLQAPHLVKKSGYGSPKKTDAKPASAKKLTPAQQKAEDKRKAKAAAEQLKKRLPIWRRRFERMALAVQTPAGNPVILCTLAWWVHRSQMCETWIVTAMESLGCKGSSRTKSDMIALLIGATDGTGQDVVDRLWRILVWPQQLATWPIGPIEPAERLSVEPPKVLPVSCEWGGTDKDIEPQMKLAGVDLATAWRAASGEGPERMMLVELLKLHTSGQLDTLGTTWKLELKDLATKRAKIEAIVAAHKKTKPLALPKVLK